MNRLSHSKELCPLGVKECPVAAEISHLKEEIKQLQDLTQTDPLTGLFNFRYLVSALEREMERTRRTRIPTGLIMADLDHFKRINDTYGHQNGNEALRRAAGIWRESLRRIDVPCRYGGEEFSIILPNTRLHQAIAVAERMRATLAETPMDFDGEKVTLTASFGVDIYYYKEALSADGFIKRVDDFLRQAKTEGRNRVCHEEIGPVHVESGVTGEERAALFITDWPDSTEESEE